jgi:alpha-galactosidase
MKTKYVVILAVVMFLTLNGSAQKFEELAPTPPMGWNRWNKFGCNVSETLISEMADAIVSSGMRDAGYEYVVMKSVFTGLL